MKKKNVKNKKSRNGYLIPLHYSSERGEEKNSKKMPIQSFVKKGTLRGLKGTAIIEKKGPVLTR